MAERDRRRSIRTITIPPTTTPTSTSNTETRKLLLEYEQRDLLIHCALLAWAKLCLQDGFWEASAS